jgi:2'-hydroxyisoflavone reductase
VRTIFPASLCANPVAAAPAGDEHERMRILIIGGGRFLGRAFAAEALAAGHEVTVFNRGRTSARVEGAQVVHGDRENAEDLAGLTAAGPWDAIVDTSGYVPKVVGDGARILAESAEAYLFISSISALAEYPAAAVGFGARLFDCAPDATEGDYGPLKAGCERAVREAFPGRVIVHYPGLILGPHENVGRSWWLPRIARGGDVLAPGDPQRRMQMIDARDIARFGLRCLESGAETGKAEGDGLLLTSPTGHTTFEGWLDACIAATGADAHLVWAPDELLLEHGIAPWSGLPLWSPVADQVSGVWSVDVSDSLAAGLVCRPIEETMYDTWAVLRDKVGSVADADGRINNHGLAPEAEEQVLAALRGGQDAG